MMNKIPKIKMTNVNVGQFISVSYTLKCPFENDNINKNRYSSKLVE